MKLVDAWILSEELLERYGKKPQNKRNVNPHRKIFTDEDKREIENSLKNYRQTELQAVPLRKRKAGDEKENDFLEPAYGFSKLSGLSPQDFFKVNKKKLLKKIKPRSIKCSNHDITVQLYKVIVRHVQEHNNTTERARLRLVKFLINTLMYPQEIWEQTGSERYVFIKKFTTIENRQTTTFTMIAAVGSDYQLITYYRVFDDNEANMKRTGKCLYPKESI